MSVLASVIVAEDLLTSLSGKANINNVFTNDILIPGELLTQLVFIFKVEGEQSDLPRNFRYEVQLPGEAIQILERPVPEGWRVPEEREKWVVFQPFLVGPLMLRPGKIEVRIIMGEKTIHLAAPWINLFPTASPPPSEQSQSAES
jgi:hypothetical protein